MPHLEGHALNAVRCKATKPDDSVRGRPGLKAPGADANPQLKQYFGVWGKGEWSGGICNALVVSEINGDKATVQYFYGTGPGVPVAGSFVKTDAAMKGKYLHFTSAKGADVSYELAGGQLRGWFGSIETDKKLQKLQ